MVEKDERRMREGDEKEGQVRQAYVAEAESVLKASNLVYNSNRSPK